MGQLVNKMQVGLKRSTGSIINFLIRALSGLFLGFVFAIIGQVLIGYGILSYVFVIVAGLLVFLRITRRWTTVTVLVFDLICVLVGLLLRMYILMAPGI